MTIVKRAGSIEAEIRPNEEPHTTESEISTRKHGFLH
jgi:hypothetical protein